MTEEDPELYRLEGDADFGVRIGNVAEVVPYDVGFRKICMQDGLMELNGERLIINGVNRHEWNASEAEGCISEDR